MAQNKPKHDVERQQWPIGMALVMLIAVIAQKAVDLRGAEYLGLVKQSPRI